MSELNCVYEDEHLLVLDKPSGLLCVPGRGPDKQDCLSLRALQHFGDALVVHRLDQATSGLVIMARNLPVQRQLSHAFAERQVAKRYVAVVAGQVFAQLVARAHAVGLFGEPPTGIGEHGHERRWNENLVVVVHGRGSVGCEQTLEFHLIGCQIEGHQLPHLHVGKPTGSKQRGFA